MNLAEALLNLIRLYEKLVLVLAYEAADTVRIRALGHDSLESILVSLRRLRNLVKLLQRCLDVILFDDFLNLSLQLIIE
jgi:hypothetical protein